MSFKKPVCVITGVLGGIGSSLAEVLQTQHGYFIIGIDVLPMKQSEKFIDKFIQCNIASLALNSEEGEAVATNLVDVISKAGPLKVLINNAAKQIVKPIEDTSIADWNEVMATNVGAPFALIKLALPFLKKCKGSIINIASIHANLTKPEFVAYASSKGALVALTRALAVELGHVGIRVNAILPAATSTPMLLAGFEGKPVAFKALERMHPLGRICAPSEIAEVVAFLASNKAEFVSGAAWQIDGGIGGRLHDPV